MPKASATFFELSLFDRHYKLQSEVLGKGASGDVLTATCKQTGKVVAVKSFDKIRLTSQKVASMRSEMELHTSTSHSNIARVIAVYESDGLAHMVLEHLPGGELFHRVLEFKRVEEAQAIHVTRQLLQAVVYLHDRRIMHRDIKMENLLFDARGSWNVKLIDFGFATRFGTRSSMMHRCGTLLYAAPEVVAGTPYDEEVDIWSIGAVVYAMLTGQMLYGGKEQEVYSKAKSGSVDYGRRFSMLSDDAQRFIYWLLSVSPSQRPSAREALAHPWLQSAPAWPADWLQQAFADLSDIKGLWSRAINSLGVELPQACEPTMKTKRECRHTQPEPCEMVIKSEM